MTKEINNIKIEKCLFFDIETVGIEDTLDPESKLFKMFSWKQRDRKTNEEPSVEEVQELFEQKAPVTFGYNKIIAIAVAYASKEVLRKKVLVGEENKILKEFFEICNKFDYLVSFNGIEFDMPTCVFNANKYFNVTEVLSDKFNTAGKKIWNLNAHIDLFQTIKGPYYGYVSFDEACYTYNVPSPKTLFDGSKVNKEWWRGDKQKVIDYAYADVEALANLFRAIRHEPLFTEVEEVKTEIDDRDIWQKIASIKTLTAEDEKKLKEIYANDFEKNKLDALLKAALFTINPHFGAIEEKTDQQQDIQEIINKFLEDE